ncbi:MAG: TetR/AcrR family transcriptional regulator [Pseudomonadota bacterium]
MPTAQSTAKARRPDKIKTRLAHTKVTRQDWLMAARDTLVSEGVGEVKILVLSAQLNVARSSFYWYFDSRADLLAALLSVWEARNTRCIIDKCAQPANNITQALCHFFECFVDGVLFDQGLDFAVREWSRRDPQVRTKIDAADTARISAVIRMFERHGYSERDSDGRARILYFMQLGYHALEVKESMETRMSRLEPYVRGFSGQDVDITALEDFKSRAFALANEQSK